MGYFRVEIADKERVDFLISRRGCISWYRNRKEIDVDIKRKKVQESKFDGSSRASSSSKRRENCSFSKASPRELIRVP